MKVDNKKASNIKLCYIGGGSRGWAWKFMTDLAIEPDMSGEVRLYDIDFEAAKNNEIIGNKITDRKDALGKWEYKAVTSLEEALTGADFVIISILPGTFKEMRSDVHEPEKLGIYQPVGDTAGPGGMIRALRTIPMYVEIAEAIKKFSPDAWVMNYTNPMSLCVKALFKVFPEIKAFGCCHEVLLTQDVLAALCNKHFGIESIERKDIRTNVIGINHFTWFDEASYGGYDIFPIYKEYVKNNFEEGYNDPKRIWTDSPFNSPHRVKFDLFNKYGCIAAAGDRHLVEFMPGDSYLKDPETIKSWRFGLTTIEYREGQLQERLDKSAKLISGEADVDMEPSGEEGVVIMKALVGLDRVVTNVNIPNTGQVANLPLGAVVETNAVFSRDSIKPIIIGRLPEEICKLTMPHVENHDYIIEAALTCDKEPVVKAFLNDPNTKGKCKDEGKIRDLVDAMIENTKEYLPEKW